MKVSTAMMSGRTRQRRLFAEGPAGAPVRLALRGLQFVVFKSYFQHTLEQGTLPFLIDLPTGDGVAEHECQFIGMYKWDQTGHNRWLITARLQIERLDVVSAELGEYLGAFTNPEDATPFTNRLRIFVRDDVPPTLGDITP